jgi:hypothetical protein
MKRLYPLDAVAFIVWLDLGLFLLARHYHWVLP